MTNNETPAAVQLIKIALVALLLGAAWFAVLIVVVVLVRELAREVLPVVLDYLRRRRQ